ncbi:dihydropteroate synthase [Akkermansiaceae bacterium]|nr:dihydropteroate synthase [Akkermansiaceae bacterium]
MTLRFPSREVTFPRRPLLMGIVNINDDSFCGDGSLDLQVSLQQAREHCQNGADIIDIGAESARTNREAISIDEEVRRLNSFIEQWPAICELLPKDNEQLSPPLLSVNTWRPEVVEQVLGPEIDLLNDMSALPTARNAELCAQHQTVLLIMHSVGLPKVAHTHQKWDDLLGSMKGFFKEKTNIALRAGLSKEQLILDPGLDFAKQKEDNLLLLRELDQLIDLGYPLLLPISRKTVIGDVLGIENPQERDAGTLALLTHGMMKGAHIFRVHNVKECWQALKVLSAF